uniref:Pyruvate kinase n=1 Tax=Odontella aurita TaxID=265563 RepID=A0A6U6CXZ9_9STRA|mmetsp:Transcript_16995/g.49087  ORF Transcript_16995/g.49087 Transcript_16995/m.49087 type:complete len:543 (+) Transcript_16995:176-1804(+)|eukprot:CAMPEP_0113527676 /NCGR_PEP_ID=MMETSP0015_2-20120614/1424_1 /TAXON_ID=2838 /ORGANISM="Odontella" /LENGTH=542 /DNA_ID=CAMNT_0000426129 /DNA_START=1192 /DNA_END=2823 /DNA_ORIENTATION=- /assembly_acc=CAM_ASM_000160
MSVSNTSSVPTLAGGFISVDTVKRPTQIINRRTKIVCTLGPACWEVSQLETLIEAGMNIARFNFSHGSHEGHKACLDRLREAAKNKNQNVAVMLDTKGPEIRSGFFGGGADKICLVKGENLILTTDYDFKGDKHKLACSYPALATSVKPGQSILVADGSLVLTVLSCDEADGEVTCRVENNASIGERKNMNLPGVVVDLPTLTEKDCDDIVNFGIRHNVDFIAASFVRKASDVKRIRTLLAENGGQHIKIICKIENLEGLENYMDILKATDAIMVARGDLGMEIPPEKVFLAQKYMIREANIAGKPVITATQMLESMIVNPRPTRAECSDVANAVFDGTDCVMLSGETANGPNFEAAVKVMVATCCESESSINFNLLYQSIRNSVVKKHRLSAAESIASSAVKTAIDVGAKAIVVLSESGASARMVAKFRPSMPVAVLTPSETVARQSFGILKACYAFVVEDLEDTDALVTECTNEIRLAGVAKEGDPFVVVCGKTFGRGATNQIKVEYVQSSYWDQPPEAESDMSAHNAGRDSAHKGCTIS